ncbi:hypothetical protein NIES4101_73190 [Calothrix sp. NIES-4101]|nr:hypothetical protein NIES4101_73190 [Calothrix sp. NIES-4101]
MLEISAPAEQFQELPVPQQENLIDSTSIEESIGNRDHLITKESQQFQLFSRCTIRLFKLAEKASCPEVLMTEVLSWTNKQPLLTQKLCQLLAESQEFIAPGTETAAVQKLVQTHLLQNWETQLAGEHLQGICETLIHNQQCEPLLLLELYQAILDEGELAANNSPEQAELLRLRLVGQEQDKLKVGNRIYQSVFDRNWVEQELAKLRLLSGFTLELCKLAEKASCPEVLMTEVLSWTNKQPLLTQKLCQLLAESQEFIAAGTEATTVQQLVQTYLLQNWETQLAGEHLQGIRDTIVHNQQCDPLLLLELYQEILREGETLADNSPEQTELLRLRLLVQQQDKLKISNRIYQSVFDHHWVEQELEEILHSSLANTTIYNPNSADNTLSVTTTTKTRPEPKIKKRVWILLAIAGLMLCGSGLIFLGFSLFRWSQVETIFKSSNRLLHRGDYQQALDKYNQLLKLDSNYYESWTNRGYALAGLKDYNQMLESCTTATIINPEAVFGWNCRGEALYNLKQYDQAMAAFDQAISLDPKDPVFWINKSIVLLALNQTDKALTTANQAIELSKQILKVEHKDAKAKELAIAFTTQAQVLAQKQEYEAALTAYEQALKYNPQYFVALRGKGITLQSLNRDDQAIAQFYFVLEHHQLTNPQKAEIWYYSGLSLCKFHQTEKAIAAFDRALKFKPDYQAAAQGKMACPQ